MKHASPNSKLTLSITALVFFTSWNGSVVDSNNKDKRPDVNFYGTLQDHSNKIISIEDILINGKYKQIPVYQIIDERTASKTKTSVDQSKAIEMDPKQNKTLLDLNDIASIALKHPDKPIEHEIEINNHKYIEIMVTLINGSVQNYLIESSRDLSCLKVDQGQEANTKPIFEERKLNMIHVKNLIIKGKKSAQDINSSRMRDEMNSSDKVEIAKNTEEILDQIEKNVKDLPENDPSQYEKFKKTIVSLLRSLRDQLQKMLSMIKN
jgi:hypothetical protein